MVDESRLALLIVFLVIAVPTLSVIPWIVRRRRAERTGEVVTGTVLSMRETGRHHGMHPEIRLVLEYRDRNGNTGQTVLTYIFSLITLPHLGQRYVVALNPERPAECFMADQAAFQRRNDALI